MRAECDRRETKSIRSDAHCILQVTRCARRKFNRNFLFAAGKKHFRCGVTSLSPAGSFATGFSQSSLLLRSGSVIKSGCGASPPPGEHRIGLELKTFLSGSAVISPCLSPSKTPDGPWQQGPSYFLPATRGFPLDVLFTHVSRPEADPVSRRDAPAAIPPPGR